MLSGPSRCLRARSSGGTAQVIQFSNANPASIVAQAPVAVNAPGAGSTTSTVGSTFPAQSTTLLVVPK
jgi:hypothetical protein